MCTKLGKVPNYNVLLDDLFNRWREKSKEIGECVDQYDNIIFTEDGLMEKNDTSIDVSKKWWHAQTRIMFLLKDQPSDWSDDARLWLRDQPDKDNSGRRKNRELKNNFMKRLACLLYGLTKSTKKSFYWYGNLQLEDVKEFFNIEPFAFVECKKQGGKNSISNKTLRQYLERYGDFLKEEIDILKPNILVCTNLFIYDFVLKQYNKEDLVTFGEQHQSIKYHPKTKTVILCSYHPSARKSDVVFYEGVLWHYNEFVNSKYFESFINTNA